MREKDSFAIDDPENGELDPTRQEVPEGRSLDLSTPRPP